MRQLRAGLDAAADILLWIGVVAGLLMMLHVSADVVGRSLFRHPLPGTTEIVSGYYMVLVAFLPWAWIAARDDHIKVELFTLALSARATAALDTLVRLATALYMLLFTWQTVVAALQATRSGETWEASTGYIPVWPSRWLLPVAGAAMTAHLITRVTSDLVTPKRIDRAPDDVTKTPGDA